MLVTDKEILDEGDIDSVEDVDDVIESVLVGD